ncbi:MAG: riboflavin synthase [Deltaproteobacteria bacterium]|nr:riboflavin synthase [Deltaproteobacteria bacterium]
MFTGIIEQIGRVKSVEKQGASGRITVETGLPPDTLKCGDSIAVDGACLTITGLLKGAFHADLSEETLRLTTLGALKSGDRVNIERALTLSKPLGGHIVTGHVDGSGTIKGLSKRGDFIDIELGVPAHLMAHIVNKGSVAIDGISLTIGDVLSTGFKAALIPHTLKNTALSFKGPGSKVNIETDIIAKYVEKLLSSVGKRQGISEDFLSQHGFLRKG